MQITARFYASQVRKTAETLGVALPAALAEKLDRADVLADAAATMLGTGGDLNEAVLDAIEAGRDIHTDEVVQRRAVERMLANQGAGIVDAARQRSLQQKRAALVEHADDVLAQWSEALAPYTAALVAAAGALPVDDLDNVRGVITQGTDAVQHWTDAQRAVVVWNAAIGGFAGFAAAAGIDHGEYQMLIVTAAHVGSPKNIDVWSLSRRGVALSLPTLAEFRARTAALEAAAEAAAEAAIEANGDDVPPGRFERIRL